MLQRKLYGWGSSSPSLEWHPPLIALFCYTVTILEPLLKPKSWDPISTPNIFYTVIILSERSWIEMMSTFRRSMGGRIWSIHLLKLSESRSSMITNRRWVYDTIPIGFSPSGSCWELCHKINRQSIDDWAYYYNCIWIIKLINIIWFFHHCVHLILNSYYMMKSLGLFNSI